MSIQEVKLTQEQVNTFIRFSGYSVHYKPRKINPSHGGGVLILVNSKIAVTELSGLNLDVDHLNLKIDSKGVSFNLISLYAPSNTLKKELIRSYCELGDELIILGDLNAKTPVVECRSLDANGRVLEEVINSESNLCVLNEPSRPTYFRFNNNSKKVDYSEILDLFLCSNSLANKMTSIETEPRFNFTRADWALFGSELDGMITEINCKSLDDINSFDEIFSNLVNVSASKAIPKCTATTLKSYPRPIVILIKARQALRKKKKKKERTNSEELKILNTEFNKLTRQIKVAIKKYTEDRWANFLGKLGPYPASSSIFWSIINRARTQKKGSGIPTLIQDGKIYETDKDKANLFASILSKTYSESGEECNEFDKNCYNYVEDFVSKLDYSDDQFSKVSFLELVNIIDRLKIDSSPGEDGIHNRFLKKLSFKAVNLLLDMINLSLCVGMPEAWKVAVITMIPKKTENSTDPNDYRGISLLSCLGKLAERVIKNRLYSFLESKKLLIDEQSGFRTNRGTSDNLLFMTQKIQERLNKHNGSKVCGIFFDISKAFDKVWHAGLIYKLVYLGVPMYLV